MTKQSGQQFAAVDLGATSGRVILGRIDDGQLRTRQVARFANDPVALPDGLHWNVLALYRSALLGIMAAEREEPGSISSIGVDSWAVDYGLLRNGRLLGAPFHYRDERNARAVLRVHDVVGSGELFRRNGLQHLDFNTVFQLAAEDPETLRFADRLLLVPDLLNYWLTGRAVAERTNASTTGLLSPVDREWDTNLADTLGIPLRLLPELVDAGVGIGPLTGPAATAVGRPIDVVTVGSHDTASAVAAIPATGRDFAYISCGTWGLVGLELDAPILNEDVRRANFTNEGGIDGTVRFLRNVMGLWLLSESLRHWAPAATDDERTSLLLALLEEADRLPHDGPVFDVNAEEFMAPGDIPGRICAWYRTHGERVPEGRPQIVRAIVDSMAAAFVDAVSEACQLANHTVSVIHIVGGGSQNTLLCRAIADRSGLPVLAGPVEATAMGNLLVQARAMGAIGDDLASLRQVVVDSTRPVVYAPR